MRIYFPVLILAIFFTACDESRVYEQNHDFEGRLWPAAEKPEFEFEVKDTLVIIYHKHHVHCS